jgi:predicted GTPase
MTVLMSVQFGNGKKGKCDSRCYDAIRPDCSCVCGGINHGVGYLQAKQNIEKIVDGDSEAWDELRAKVREQYPEAEADLILNAYKEASKAKQIRENSK